MNDTDFRQGDELEQHLHASLRNFAPEAPERLWPGIEARLPRRRRRPVLFRWLTGVGMAVSLTGTISLVCRDWNFWENVCRENEVCQKKSPRPETLNTVELLPGNKSMNPSLKTDENRDAKGRSDDQKIVSDALPANKEIKGADTGPKKTPDKINNTASVRNRLEHDAPVTLSPKPSAESDPLFEKKGVVLLETVSPKFSIPARNRHEIHPVLFSITKISQEKRWSVGPVAGPVWMWHAASPAGAYHSGHAAFAEYHDGPATGWQAGIGVNFILAPHWRVGTGFWRRTTTQTFSHQATLRLMDGICLNPNDNGPKEYEFEYALVSGGSEANVTVHIAQVNNQVTMPHDEPFTLSMHTTRRNTDWVMPVALQRTFGQKRFHGYLEAGALLGLSGRRQIQADHFSEACLDLCFTSGRIPELVIAEKQKISASWMFGTGLEYLIARNWRLSVSPALFGIKGKTGISLNTGVTNQF